MFLNLCTSMAGSFFAVSSGVAGAAVYVEDFQGAIGPEWSHTQTDVTPLGDRKFLGQFVNDQVTLTLENLPKHEALVVTFELFVIRTWDGTVGNPAAGPDQFRVVEGGAHTLLHTTFANYPGHTQNYPDSLSSGVTHPAGYGAAEEDTLGYTYSGQGMDAVYLVSIEFPHSDSQLTLTFEGLGLQLLSDESWGIDNVVISLPLEPECPADIAPAGGDDFVNRRGFASGHQHMGAGRQRRH